jgi:hypothetical protein
METNNVARQDWSEFLEGISLEHEGWLVSVEMIGAAGMDDPEQGMIVADSTLDAIDCELDDGESTLIISFTDNKPLHIEDLARVSHDEVDAQDGKIIELETRHKQIIRLWLRMPRIADIEDLVETDIRDRPTDNEVPPPAESILQIKPMP